MFGRLTMIAVGTGSPTIVAKNRQSQKPAPVYVLWALDIKSSFNTIQYLPPP